MASVLTKLRLVPRTLWALLAVQLLFVLLLLTSIGGLFHLGSDEVKRATGVQQRIVIDAKTGMILSPLAAEAATDASFIPEYDVAPDDGGESTPPKDKATPPAPAPTEDASPTPQEDAPPAPKALAAGALDTGKAPAVAPIPRNHGSLIPAPAPEVSDITPKGALPKVTKDISPSMIYAPRYVWDTKNPKPAIAVLVVGLGMNARSMEAALTLPSEVAFSFSPYGENAAEWVEWARNAGHEAWMDLPSQTRDFPRTDPGPYGIFKGLPPSQILEHMHEAMFRFPGFVGMTLPLDQSVLAESGVAVTMLEELGKRGLLLAVPSSNVDIARLAHVAPHRKEILLADTIIDSTPSEAFIRARLAKLEDEVKRKNRMFVVVGNTPLSLTLVAEWARTLKGKDILLVPPTAFIDRPEPPPAEEEPKKSSGH